MNALTLSHALWSTTNQGGCKTTKTSALINPSTGRQFSGEMPHLFVPDFSETCTVIIDPSTGETISDDKEGRPRRPLIMEIPEPRLEIVTRDGYDRLRELEQSGAIWG